MKQQSLFGDEAPTTSGAYPKALARAEPRPSIEPIRPDSPEGVRLRELIRRAIEQINQGQPMTARAILQGADLD